MTENDYMPFGTYGPDKGDHRKLKDIPAGYLVWLYDSDFAWVNENHPEVYNYIEENLDQIESEIARRKGRDY